MQQSEIVLDPTVCHCTLQTDRLLQGVAYFPEKSDQEKIVIEALKYYRLMVFFKNYPYSNPGDLVMVYLWIVTSHYLKTIEKEETEQGARQKLMEIAREPIPKPGDRNYFMGGLLKDNRSEQEALSTYFKQLKEVLVSQLLKILFTNGQKTFEFKFWVSVSKRKFLGLSYTGL